MNTKEAKDKLRQKVVQLKNENTPENLLDRSEEVFSVLEITGEFQNAKKIFIYNSLKDEVSTVSFIEKWKNEKTFYLPSVVEDRLVFRPYTDNAKFRESNLGILEPIDGDDYTDYNKIDIIIIPGMAFDRKMNRLGRGKGYYDRFLTDLTIKKIGVCFDFQLLGAVPADNNDIKMDMIVSENELIW